MNRHNARLISVQAIYQWEMGQDDLSEITGFRWVENKSDTDMVEFAKFMVMGVINHWDFLLNEFNLVKKSLGLYSISELNKCILMLSFFSLKYQQEIDSIIILDESVRLSKEFSEPDSYKMVNSAVDFQARKLGLIEPKKYDGEAKKKIKIVRSKKL